MVTTPGQLVFSGDGESFVFRRTTDMFEFFRSGIRRSGATCINADYWSEKLASDRDSVRTYSQERFEQRVSGELKEAEPDWPGITKAARRGGAR